MTAANPRNVPLMPGQEKPMATTAFVNMRPERITDRDMLCIVAAIVFQHVMHYCPLLGKMSSAFYYAGQGQAVADKALAQGEDLHLILGAPDQPNALGYHAKVGDRSVSKTFADPTLDNGGTVLGDPDNPTGESVAVTASHEASEADGNRDCGGWEDGPPRAEGSEYALEESDPVEGDSYGISVSDPADDSKKVIVQVSNFVTRAWFDAAAPAQDSAGVPTLFDYMGKLTAPFTMDANGYMIVRNGPGTEKQVFANEAAYPDWKKALHALPHSRFSRIVEIGKKELAARQAKQA